MGFIDVRIKNADEVNTPPFGYMSWLEYWEMTKGKRANACEVMTCTELPETVGWIVIEKKGMDNYIIPMCKACSSKPDGEVVRAWENHMLSVKASEK